MDGNLADWSLDDARAEPLKVAGQAGYTFEWSQARSRANQALSTPSLDEQVEAALAKRPLHAGITDAVTARPEAWLRGLSGASLPGYEFQHTRRETCDSCSGRKQVNCGNCSASGSVRCHVCSGTGTERVNCNQCFGVGHHRRTRTVQVHTGERYENRTEYYNENCWGCGGTGRRNATCRDCNGSGYVRCGPCSGSGKVTCADCKGVGQRLYLYVRKALINSRIGLGLKDVAHEGWRDLLHRCWEAVLDARAMKPANIRPKDENPEGVVKLYFDAAGSAAEAMARSGNHNARYLSVGIARPVVLGEPLLANALGLPKDGEEADWVSLTERLAGTRMLREAIDISETLAKQAKGGKDKLQAAQAEGITAAALRDYGATIGPDGACALASIVIHGVGALRNRSARKVWLTNFGIALGVGLICAAVGIFTLLGQQKVTDHAFRDLGTIFGGTLAAGIAWAVLAHWRVRHRLQHLSRALDLETPLAPARHGWMRWGGAFVVLIILAVFLGTLFGAYKIGMPSLYRQVIDRQATYADGAGPYLMTTAETPLRQWADDSSQSFGTLPAGTRVRPYGDEGGEWRLVYGTGDYGYVQARMLGPVPTEASQPCAFPSRCASPQPRARRRHRR